MRPGVTRRDGFFGRTAIGLLILVGLAFAPLAPTAALETQAMAGAAVAHAHHGGDLAAAMPADGHSGQKHQGPACCLGPACQAGCFAPADLNATPVALPAPHAWTPAEPPSRPTGAGATTIFRPPIARA
jgi:hypothetical protein